MSKTAAKFIKQARSWIGRKESNGTHQAIIDVYNNHRPLARSYTVKYTDSWCATFVSAVAIKLGYTDIIPTECSCQNMIQLFKNAGIWVENENRTPNPGDIIFYDWQDNGSGDNQGWSDHVGIVEAVTSGKITVIEGNYQNAVKRRNLDVNGRYIRGYGVPKYDKEQTNTAKKSIEKIAEEVLAGMWGNGDARKTKIQAAGYNYSEVQAAVNRLVSVKKTVDEIAKEVIAGKWGSGAVRKKRLANAGYNYSEVQKKVNAILK